MKGERAYIYAKACGMIARSFVGDRVKRLASVSSTEALQDMVFGAADTGLDSGSGGGTIEDIEKRLALREREAVASIMRSFRHPPPLLRLLADGDSPAQNLAASQTEAGSVSKTADLDENIRQSALYYRAFWEELEKIPLSDRQLITKIAVDEMRLKNAVWALRLRVYYSMPPGQIRAFLIDPCQGKSRIPLRREALHSLTLDIEEESQWHDWRFWRYLNKPAAGQYWKVDPRFFQNQAALRLYHLARQCLRRRPFSLDTSCCFIKLKQFEKDVLTSIAEAARLGMTGGDALAILGLSA
jgi:hypothetical protein